MVRTTGLLLTVFLLLFASADFAGAKRLGGGGSIGNRQSFSTTTRPSPSGSSGFFGSQQQQARPNPMGGTQNPGGGFSRPGFGGMLGGLLVGGLLGSMFFGGGHGAAGGYGGPGLLDLLLIGGGLFLFFKFLSARRSATQSEPPLERTYEADPMRDTAASGWGNLGASPAAPSAAPQIPQNFDTAEFLTGAKTLFTRLQRSWSARDLKDIATFATTAFMDDVRKQAAEDPTPMPTDVLLVDAKLLEVREQGPVTIASAYFDTLLREDPKADHPEQVREVWHFVRREDIPGDTWRLDAIQQLDA